VSHIVGETRRERRDAHVSPLWRPLAALCACYLLSQTVPTAIDKADYLKVGISAAPVFDLEGGACVPVIEATRRVLT
jgi:hypothetical protein